MMRDVRTAPARRRTLAAALALAVGATAACGGKSDTAADSASGAAGDAAGRAATAAATAAATDTGMAGMDHSQMAGMNRSAPKDSNQAFLRMMSDHHEGLVAMADSAMPRLQGGTAKADAQKLRQKQHDEQQRMLAMLTKQYGDSVTPMVMPSNRAMTDSVTRAQGAAADPTFYRQVVAHHREGVSMAEPMIPRLTGEVKQMAEKAVADQRREIQEFERKARGGTQ